MLNTFCYIGIAVLVYFIAQLLNYWKLCMEDDKKRPLLRNVIDVINFILLLLSLPVGMLMYLLDQLYDSRRKREQYLRSSADEYAGKKRGYQIGKSYGYREGYKDGFEYGYEYPNRSKALSEIEYTRFAEGNLQLKMKQPNWDRLPIGHSDWSCDAENND